MQLNGDWVYRNIHGFNLLINIKSNDILKVSTLLGTLFSELKSSNLAEEILKWSIKNEINDNEKLEKLTNYFKNKGVFIDG